MIEFVDVKKKLGNKEVLNGISFRIEKGETFAVIGRSGAGKSVTLKLMVGLMQPDLGRVIIDGVDISQNNDIILSNIRRKFGFLFQGSALLNSLTVGENIGLPLRENQELPEDTIKTRIREVLEIVGLHEAENLMPSELSGGMRKRVSLARSVVRYPEIILYDEPTTGLDPIMSNVINNLIINLREKMNITSVVVTHDMNSTFMVANRIALLYHGKIIQTGSVEYFQNSQDPFIGQFVKGSPNGPFEEET
jgi:phospholipid/cholesterol/gamma-HCH transport system ATP-binding protein